MRLPTLSAVFGLLLVVVVLPLSYSQYASTSKAWGRFREQAAKLDVLRQLLSGGPCSHPLKSVSIQGDQRVVPVGTSFNLLIALRTEEECNAEVTVHAVNFEMSGDHQSVALKPGEEKAAGRSGPAR